VKGDGKKGVTRKERNSVSMAKELLEVIVRRTFNKDRRIEEGGGSKGRIKKESGICLFYINGT